MFACEVCGRRTRNSAAAMSGASGVDKTCEECYEIAGIYNVYQDQGVEGLVPYGNEIRELCSKIMAHGGKLDGDADQLLELVGSQVCGKCQAIFDLACGKNGCPNCHGEGLKAAGVRA